MKNTNNEGSTSDLYLDQLPPDFFNLPSFPFLILFFIGISVQKYLLERSLKNTHFDDVDLLEVFSEEEEEGEDDWDMSTYLYQW